MSELKLSRTVRVLLAVASGVALALAFPLYNVPLLGWIAPALLILAVLDERPRFALLLGVIQGACFYGLSIPWIYTVLRQYGPLPVPVAATLFLMVVAASSLFRGAFAALVAWISRFSVTRACIAASFLWVTAEFSIGRLPAIGFPWNLLGYVAAHSLALVQMTAITGIFGLSLLVAAYGALVAWVSAEFFSRRKRGAMPLAAVTVLVILIAGLGARFVPEASADHAAHLVQTNFPVSMSYPNDWMRTHAAQMDELERISTDSAQKQPGLVIWPEVPAPFSLQDADFESRAARIARGAGHGFLVGVVDLKRLPDNRIGATNSAALLAPNGSLEFMYDKIHLVPFSEYIPGRKYLSLFVSGLTGIVGDFQAGTEYKVAHDFSRPFSVYICYEAIFPNEIRRFALGGAQLFINISDDAWFGGSGAAAQHLAMARVRAVENRRWLLRDTNDGITVSVDPYGRIVARLPEQIRGELDAPYGFRSDLTPYTRWGDWLAWLCVLVSLMLLLITARESRARRKPNS